MLIIENQRRDEVFQRILLEQEKKNPVVSDYGTSYHVLPDLTKNVPIFRGQTKDDPKKWLDKITSMKMLHHWPDAFALETARSNLEGGAQEWYLSRKRVINTFEDFVCAFKKTFLRQEDLPSKWKKMTERYQGREEDINDYFHEKCNLCDKLGLNVQETKEEVLIGLYDSVLCSSLLLRTHSDLDE